MKSALFKKVSGIFFVLLTPNVCYDHMENMMNNEENDEAVDRDDAGENGETNENDENYMNLRKKQMRTVITMKIKTL